MFSLYSLRLKKVLRLYQTFLKYNFYSKYFVASEVAISIYLWLKVIIYFIYLTADFSVRVKASLRNSIEAPPWLLLYFFHLSSWWSSSSSISLKDLSSYHCSFWPSALEHYFYYSCSLFFIFILLPYSHFLSNVSDPCSLLSCF